MMIIKFADTGLAKKYGLTIDDVTFEKAGELSNAPALLIVPNDDEYPIEDMGFGSFVDVDKQMKAFNDEKEMVMSPMYGRDSCKDIGVELDHDYFRVCRERLNKIMENE